MRKALLGLCLVSPVSAIAQDLSYDYVDGAWHHVEGDHGVDGDGAAVQIGWAPGENIYTKFNAGWIDVDNSSADSYGFGATVGGHAPLAQNVDIYLGVSGLWDRVDTQFAGNVDGYG